MDFFLLALEKQVFMTPKKLQNYFIFFLQTIIANNYSTILINWSNKNFVLKFHYLIYVLHSLTC
ncbi:hypothetical protein BpHYR1_047909 [Brachionus plicatilis]|uniref:Uncharacterized protein n=1 Tax=Brachionus plicatilis TaxID=10195 RepID=A0A3M7R0A3_BRAPC|nr:hypothetical protein BpHYR1_047909 [Brachionus plicatilis]